MTNKQLSKTVEVRAEVCSFNNLYEAMLVCKCGVIWKDSVAKNVVNSLVFVKQLKHRLDTDTYEISQYYEFTIYEPKRREIISTRFVDRVFQRSLCDNYLYREITNSFIYDNGACQKYRGTDFSRNRLKAHLSKYYRHHGHEGYVLQCDIKNYFGSTRHDVAKDILAKRVKDKWALQHVYKLIDSYDRGDKTGLGLGSQITQLIQLAILDDLDHFIKERLKIKYYVRYMDDIILIHHDKEYLHYCRTQIEMRLNDIHLKLNTKKSQIYHLKQGIPFLGFVYHLTETGRVLMLLSKRNLVKRRRKIRKYKILFDLGKMTMEELDDSFRSWKAHAEKGDTYWKVKTMTLYYNRVMEGKLCLSS